MSRRYTPPASCFEGPLFSLLPPERSLPRGASVSPALVLHGAGDASLLSRPCVGVIGSRKASLPGLQRATTISWALARAGIVVVSGLAKGIDSAAHRAALSCEGSTIGVIGTGLDRAYPATNSNLQEIIASEHLLLTPFPVGARVRPGNFPCRNRIMASITDATIIAEAADGSGALYQAAACLLLGRPLFLPRVVAENPALTWPADYINLPGVRVFDHPSEILEVLLAPKLARAS